MKLTTAATNQLLCSLRDKKLRAVLFYGPDKGLISHIASDMAKGLGKEMRTLTYKNAQELGLDIILNNASLFGQSEIIKITEIPTSIDADFKKLLQSDTHHIALLIADELSPTSGVRKFFETEETLASMGCYPDDENGVRKLVSDKLKAHEKTIDPVALKYLCSNLSGDRYLVLNEIEKLVLFSHDKQQVGLDDVMSSLSGAVTASPDILCISLAKGDGRTYFAESAKLLAENISPVWMIRAMIRYFLNLYIVATLKESGSSLDSAMQALRPPIFFKYVQDFKIASAKHSKADIIRILGLLSQAEIEGKSGGSANDICERLFFMLQR
jgi:DNA polymerase-3 subunit delta